MAITTFIAYSRPFVTTESRKTELMNCQNIGRHILPRQKLRRSLWSYLCARLSSCSRLAERRRKCDTHCHQYRGAVEGREGIDTRTRLHSEAARTVFIGSGLKVSMAFVGAVMVAKLDGKPKVVFVTSRPCPFAQRVWIALEEVSIPYEMQEVALFGGRKPDWFLQLNPVGKVPVLVVHEDEGGEHGVRKVPKIVTESNDICAYVARRFAPSPSQIMAEDESGRSRARQWQSWVDNELGRFGRDRVTRGLTGRDLHSKELEGCLQHIETVSSWKVFTLCAPLSLHKRQRFLIPTRVSFR